MRLLVNTLCFIISAALTLFALPFWLVELGLSWRARKLDRPHFCLPKDCDDELDWLFSRRTGLAPGEKDMVRLFGVQFRYA